MSTGEANAEWIVSTSRAPGAPVRLFAFAHAGGDASSFDAWPVLLDKEVDVRPVQLPGRGGRAGEPMPERIEDLVGELALALSPHLDQPYLFFGHGMGALVAFELARALRRDRQPAQQPGPRAAGPRAAGPRALIVSAAPPPHTSGAALSASPQGAAGGDDDASLPVIRADLAALAHYRYEAGDPLDADIVAIDGISAPGYEPGDPAGWAMHTRGRFHVARLPGAEPNVRSALRHAERPVTQIVATVCREAAHAVRLQREHGERLAEMRRELDAIDDQLVAVLTRRLHHCDRIAEIKRQHDIPMMQPHRVEHVKQRCAERAHKAGIDPQFVIDLYTRIIEETCRRETKIIDGEP